MGRDGKNWCIGELRIESGRFLKGSASERETIANIHVWEKNWFKLGGKGIVLEEM